MNAYDVGREYTRQMADKYNNVFNQDAKLLDEPIEAECGSISILGNQPITLNLEKTINKKFPTLSGKMYNPYKEDIMDKKERFEQFKKEELFFEITDEGNNYYRVFCITKTDIPSSLDKGSRIFRLDALKEVTKAEVVVE